MATRQEVDDGVSVYGNLKSINKPFKPPSRPQSYAQKRKMSEEDINHDPISSSDLEGQESADSPSPKKARLNPNRSRRGGRAPMRAPSTRYGLGAHITEKRKKEEEEARMKAKEEEEARAKAREAKAAAAAKKEQEDDNDNLFGEMSGSQKARKGKVKRTFGRTNSGSARAGTKNIHASGPSKRGEENGENSDDGKGSQDSGKNPKQVLGFVKPQDVPIRKTAAKPRDPGFVAPTPKAPTPKKKPASIFKTPAGPEPKARPVFKMPAMFPDDPSDPTTSISTNDISQQTAYGTSHMSSPLSSPPSSPGIISSQVERHNLIEDLNQNREDETLQIECPMCGDLVDRSFYNAFTRGNTDRLTIKQQTRFCKKHKLHDAETEWTRRGYPTIDWDNLDKRLVKHVPYLRRILKGDQSSFYLNKLALAASNDKQRTLIQTMAMGRNDSWHLSAGYYGTRGANAMSEFVIHTLSKLLREQAAGDKLIAFGGASAYVQTVLVPELTTRLVMEDMDVDEEEARRVLQQSAEIGEVFNDEEEHEQWKRRRRRERSAEVEVERVVDSAGEED